MIKVKTEQVIAVQDWDELVRKTYNRPYSLQQQDGCMSRCRLMIVVPDEPCDFENDSIPEVINGDEIGVSFAAWLARDPKQPIPGSEEYAWRLDLFWERSFYPDLQMVANDLHSKGLLPAGEYVIDIDW